MASGTYNYKVKIHNYNEEQWDQQFSEKYCPPRLLGSKHDSFQTMYSTEHSLQNSISGGSSSSSIPSSQQPQPNATQKIPSGLNIHSFKAKAVASAGENDLLKSSFPGHQPALDFYNHPVQNREKSADEYYFATTSRETFVHPKQMQEKGEVLTYMPPDELDKYRKTWTRKQAREMRTEYQRQHCK
ncbi:hypothetical protein C9374_009093 [Naegleria lovaniensis]|uniref:Uncharacterized protein n=1 Tax=Naegleria lovaniensis TaxID=51637 RepID=A0AA88KEK3_NAELO|nr:uncharacterized protein C9374_009093 [Naegleria lovaniensis]KAG2377577.1 hypothetical protein C9374_009093 [Naegleria lovaniensis]